MTSFEEFISKSKFYLWCQNRRKSINDLLRKTPLLASRNDDDIIIDNINEIADDDIIITGIRENVEDDIEIVGLDEIKIDGIDEKNES